MDIKNTITLFVAIYGSVLSTYLAYMQRRDRKPKVKVKVSYGFLTSGSRISDTHILVEAANIGDKPVTVSSSSLELPDGSQVINFTNNSTSNLPSELTHGKNITFWYDVKPLASELYKRGYRSTIKIRARICDQASNVFFSKSMDFDVDEWVGVKRREDLLLTEGM